ncbi:MAG: hypothetical protein E6Q97_19980 [Desulfurellales bacterium]|nr:MAG: hypothetical protein E6Q97_19980 [Desulfurellales bacterium]
MADDLRTVLQFVGDTKGAEAAIERLTASLRRAAAESKQLFEDFARGPAAPPKIPTPDFKAPKNDALAYAQALARLQVAEGDLATAQKTLSTALQGVSKDSVAAVRAQTQLVGIEAQLSTAAGKSEAALLREAQAIARLQQVSGNTPAAIKTLEDALARTTNRSSLPALRAELQKAYLDTNYANSPLISAIDRLSQLITVSANAAAAIQNAGRGLDQGAKNASNFAANISGLRSALKNFLGDQKGEASLSLGLANVVQGIGRIDFGSLRQQAGAVFGSIRSGALSAAEGIGRLSLSLGVAAAALTGALAIGAAAFFGAIGGRALEAAKEVDAARQSIAALVGGADAANEKIAELRKLAQERPGVTTGLATTLFSQLKASSDIADASINKIIQSVGRLNAVFTIDDPKSFSRNLIQIFSQGFERADIKEALGRVPIFEQFLEEAFGTKDGAKLRALKDSGKLTLEGFLTGLSDAINTDSRFANVRESLGAQLAKASDNFAFALAPIGDQIGQAILPAISKLQPAIESAARAIADELAQAQDEFRTLTDVSGEFLDAIGDIASQAGFSFDLQEELRSIAAIIEFITGGVRLLQDIVEIAAASALFAIKGVTLAIESGLAGALDIVGIKVQGLEDDMKRLRDEVVPLFDRIEQGLINTRQFNAQRQFGPNAENNSRFFDAGNAETGPPPEKRRRPTAAAARQGSDRRKKEIERAAREEAQAELAILRQREAAIELAARRDLENLRRSLADRLISQEQFAELTIRVEQDLLAAKLQILQQEEAAAVKATKSKAAAEAKRAEFAQKRAKELQETDLRVEGLRDDVRRAQEKAEEDHQKRLVDIREAGRRQLEASIAEEVRLNRIGAVEGAERQIRIERERFDEREQLLRRELETARESVEEKQRINDELAKLAAERQAFEVEASRQIQDAQAEEAARFRASIEARVQALQALRELQLEARQAEATRLQGRFGTRNEGIAEQFRIDQERLQLQRVANERAIRDQFDQAAAAAQAARAGAAVLRQIEAEKNAALEAERQRHNIALQELLNQEFAFETAAASAFRGLFSERVNQLASDLGLFRANLDVFAQELQASVTPIDEIGRRAFEGFAQGIGSVVEQYVLLGKTGPAVIRKLLAAQLAAIAQEAAVNAIKQLALGFGALFLNPPAAAGHFTSAALWAGLAAGTGLVGRAIAPSSGGGSSAGPQSQTSENGTRVINQGGPLPTQQPTTIRIRLERGLVAERFEEDFRNNGRTRALIRSDVLRD